MPSSPSPTPAFTPPFDYAQLDAITQDELRSRGATRWALEDGAIGAFIAEADFGTAPVVVDALHRAVDEGHFAYLPAAMKADLQRSTSAFLARRYGWEVPPQHVHEMPGVVTIFDAVMRYLTSPDAAIIVPTPAYMPFLAVPKNLGRNVIEVPMLWDDAAGLHRHDLEGIAQAFAAGGELLVLCTPHNPTGRVLTREELLALAEVVDRAGGRVFSDEIWAPLTLDGRRHIPYASVGERAAQHTVTAVAASKTFNIPGLSCAQLVTSNEADRERWLARGWQPMVDVSNLGVAATIATYDDGEPWVDALAGYLTRNRDLLVRTVEERLPRARLTHPEGTYVGWIDFSAYDLPGGPEAFLRTHAAVACTDGRLCGEAGDGCVRLTYAMPQPILREALDRIVAAIEQHASSTGEVG